MRFKSTRARLALPFAGTVVLAVTLLVTTAHMFLSANRSIVATPMLPVSTGASDVICGVNVVRLALDSELQPLCGPRDSKLGVRGDAAAIASWILAAAHAAERDRHYRRSAAHRPTRHVTVVDDTAYHTCAALASSDADGQHAHTLSRVLAARATAVSKLVEESRSPVLLVDAASPHSSGGLPLAGLPRLVRGLRDLRSLPAEARAHPGRYVLLPRWIPDGPVDMTLSVPHLPPDPRRRNLGTLLYFRGACSSGDDASLGMRARTAIIGALGAISGVDVTCSSGRSDGDRALYRDYAAAAPSARFCLLIAGDSFSAGRAVLAASMGCPLVAIGPPWPLLPLLPTVDWGALVLFFSVAPARWVTPADTALMAAPEGEWGAEPRHAALLARAAAAGRIVEVGNAADVPALLGRLSVAAVAAQRRAVKAAAPLLDVTARDAANNASQAAVMAIQLACAGSYAEEASLRSDAKSPAPAVRRSP